MMRGACCWLVAVGTVSAGWLGAFDARAEVLMLQNDSFTDGGTVYFQQGFASGEQGAVTLGPVSESFQVRAIQFIFGPDDAQATITLHVYADSGTADPGAELYSAEYQVTPSSSALQEIDLTSENVVHSGAGSIRVGIELHNADLPSLARDDDGLTANVNWIDAQGLGWVSSSLFGVPGDWIIRAQVETLGGTGGSGTGGSGTGGEATGGSGTGATGAGTPTVCIPGRTEPCFGPGACQGAQVCLPDGSGYGACDCGAGGQAPTAATSSEDDGGCALRAEQRPSALPGAWLLAGLACLRLRRRRG